MLPRGVAFELLVIAGLVVVNGLFAGAEDAVLNLRPGQLQHAITRGDRGALAVRTLRGQPERFLATVQIAITVVGAGAGAFGGKTLAADLDDDAGPYVAWAADGTATVPATAQVRRLNRALGTDLPVSFGRTTIAGLCTALAERMPEPRERYTAEDGTVLEAVEVSPRRVRTVRLHRSRDLAG